MLNTRELYLLVACSLKLAAVFIIHDTNTLPKSHITYSYV